MQIRIRERGSVLFTVLIVMAMLLVLAAGGMAITSAVHRTAVTRHDRTQAYYTAKSALDGMVAYLKNADADDPRAQVLFGKIDEVLDGTLPVLKAVSPSVSDTMGTYDVAIEKYASDYIHILSKGVYREQETTTSVVMKVERGSDSLFKGAFAGLGTRGNYSLSNGQLQIFGDMYYSEKKLTISSLGQSSDKANIYGIVSNTGDIEVMGGVKIWPNPETDRSALVSRSNISINTEKDSIKVDLYAKEDMRIGGGAIDSPNIYVGGDFTANVSNIYGDVYVDGDLHSAWTQFYGNVYVNGNITGNGTFHQDVHVQGSMTSRQVNGAIIRGQAWNGVSPYEYDFIDETQYEEWVIPESKFGSREYVMAIGYAGNFMYGETKVTTSKNHTISQSGTLKRYEPMNTNWGNECSLTFDTTGGDLYIKVDDYYAGRNFQFGEHVSVNIVGDHRVFLYLDDGVGYGVSGGGGNADVGKNASRTYSKDFPPQLFIISNSAVDIDLGNNSSTFYGYIYAPDAWFKCYGGSNNERLVGSVVAGAVDVGSTATTFHYIPLSTDTGGDSGLPGGSGATTFTPIYYSE